MNRQRKAKIVATLGPASSSMRTIAAMFEAGANVFRLNFSCGSHAGHKEQHAGIRALEARTGAPIGILLDLQGPKLRIGTFGGGPVVLAPGRPFRLDLDRNRPGDVTRVPLPHPEIFSALRAGDQLLIDDGRVRLQVRCCGPDFAETTVVVGGLLSSYKGVNVPDVAVPLSSLTAQDLEDLDFGLSLGVDWVALPFVQRVEDIRELKRQIGGRARVLAKLEKPVAIDKLEAIVAEADAVMVAPRDLGIELPAARVPAIQKRIVRVCRRLGKPVVVAAQMLESMVSVPVPTLAEASDIAGAIYHGVDAVMLSTEAASGNHAVETVRIMRSLIEQVECDPHYAESIRASTFAANPVIADAIGLAARKAAELLGAAATIAYTNSGYSALRIARERPLAPIVGMTPEVATARALTLVWGVRPVLTYDATTIDEITQCAREAAYQEGLASAGQTIVITAGIPLGQPDTTNMLRIVQVD